LKMALTNKLTAIADAIREKTGDTALLTLDEMPPKITGLELFKIPEKASIHLTGNISEINYMGEWDSFFENQGDKITTADITRMDTSFYVSQLTHLPVTFNLNNGLSFTKAFFKMEKLKECPKLRGTLKLYIGLTLEDIISECTRLKDFEDLFTADMLEGFDTIETMNGGDSYPSLPKFDGCRSLRRIPSWWYKFKLCEDSTSYPPVTVYQNKTLYTEAFKDCYALDEALNIPVWKCQGKQANNMFIDTFKSTSHLKDFTFETDNGQPIVTQWKTQTIDLSSYVGYASSASNITYYNSGITTATKVTNDESYQALKDNPDWWTTNVAYSRYNHDSAVNTINSLPDTSAYLTSAGGTNTIKFKKANGSSTDGGAIENLTAEEIAVAAAKGWTVTLS
jgi:hypothetical protein